MKTAVTVLEYSCAHYRQFQAPLPSRPLALLSHGVRAGQLFAIPSSRIICNALAIVDEVRGRCIGKKPVSPDFSIPASPNKTVAVRSLVRQQGLARNGVETQTGGFIKPFAKPAIVTSPPIRRDDNLISKRNRIHNQQWGWPTRFSRDEARDSARHPG